MILVGNLMFPFIPIWVVKVKTYKGLNFRP